MMHQKFAITAKLFCSLTFDIFSSSLQHLSIYWLTLHLIEEAFKLREYR